MALWVFRTIVFYVVVVGSFILMFMNYMLTGLFLFLFISPFIAPRDKKKDQQNHKLNGKTMKKIRAVIATAIFISSLYFIFIEPKLNFVIPLFFIAIIIGPWRRRGSSDYDFDSFG